jgi:DNA-binding MarR family transcriptional regulator
MSRTWIKLSAGMRDTNFLRLAQGAPLAVWLALALHIDDQGRCWPGISRLAHITGYSRRHVSRALRRLEEIEAIEIEPRFKDHERQTNLYWLVYFVSFGENDPFLPGDFDT